MNTTQIATQIVIIIIINITSKIVLFAPEIQISFPRQVQTSRHNESG